MAERRIANLRPDQILLEMRILPLAYLPVGPLEWHGPHLPIGCDPINAENAALLAAEKTGGLVLPTFYWGTERERSPEVLNWLGFSEDEWIVGMDFPANSLPSMYAPEELFALLIREQLRLAVNFGFRYIMIISGHGAENQLAVLKRLAAEFSARGPTRVDMTMPFVTNQAGVMKVGHASLIETSIMQAIHPQTVNLGLLPPMPQKLLNTDWAIVDFETFLGNPTPDRSVHPEDDPRLATEDKGYQTIQQAVEQIAARVEAMLVGRKIN